MAGLVPVPMAPEPGKVLAVWSHLNRPAVVVDELLEPLVRPVLPHDADAGQLLTVGGLCAGIALARPHRPDPQDVAFLQFSSGSTGEPKGVELTHANVVANIAQTVAAGAATGSDVIASWLPYFHDMGLVGAHLAPLEVRIKQVKLDPLDFGKRPALWYEAATRHRATLLPMASFALAMTLKRVPADQVAAFDLSAVRMVGVGAEPIPVRTWQHFAEHLGPAGLDPAAMMPLYGLAEATVAVAFPPAGELARPLALVRSALAEGQAVDAGPDDVSAAQFMDVGSAVPGGQLRVVDDDDQPLADSRIGHVQFRGPNVARGYYGRPEETADTFVDGWVRTGDVGFLRGGRLCVTGRAKDVLFVNGRKHQAHDVEQVVADTPGAPSGRVAVVGVTDPATGAERVVVFVQSRSATADELAGPMAAVRARVRQALAYDNVRVLPLPSQDFPRTTSGKLQRAKLRTRYAAGEFSSLETEVARVCTPTQGSDAQPPRQEVEARVTAIWSEVLGVPASSIGREDRFLAIGGTSVTAMHVLARLEDAFGRPLEARAAARLRNRGGPLRAPARPGNGGADRPDARDPSGRCSRRRGGYRPGVPVPGRGHPRTVLGQPGRRARQCDPRAELPLAGRRRHPPLGCVPR
jgi:acyl-CoA synthetase (AMP-forming)/AMP-acid ligase II/acyl carrier protein